MTRRSRALTGIAALLVATVVIAAVALWPRLRTDAVEDWVPLFESIDTSALPQFSEGVRSADSVELYEGFLRDRGKGEVLKRHGWYFYLPSIAPSDGDKEALRDLVVNEAAFIKWSGPKFCGTDFHPDWFIRWTSPDGGVHELHLCFSCHEAKLYGPGYQLYCDVPGDTYKSLRTILQRYHVSRNRTPIYPSAMDAFTSIVLFLTAVILPALIFFAGGVPRSRSGTFIRSLLSIGCGWVFMFAYQDAAPFLSHEPIRANILDLPQYFGWVLPAATVVCCLLIRRIMGRRGLGRSSKA